MFVFLASVISDLLVNSAHGSSEISEKLIKIKENQSLYYIGILLGLFNSLAIVILSVLLFITLRDQNKILAGIALGWWIVEATLLVMSKVDYLALSYLSDEYSNASSSYNTSFQTVGQSLLAFATVCYDIHNLFFCLGGIIWYSMFYRSKLIPRWLSLWGVFAVSLVLVNVLLVIYDPGIGFIYIILVPYIPYELFIGLWLIIKRFDQNEQIVKT